MRKFVLVCSLLYLPFFLTLELFAEVKAIDGFMPITPDTAHFLELGYILPDGFCNFSPDGRFVYTYNGIYEIATGQNLFPDSMVRSDRDFSRDGKMLLRPEGVYDTRTLKIIFPDSSTQSGMYGIFSGDSSLLAVSGHGVFETSTWQKRFDLPGNGSLTFSPDSRWLLVGADVYNPQTGQIVYTFPNAPIYARFSPDGTMMADGDQIFSTTTWQELYYVSDPAYFSPNSRYAVMRYRGVIDTRTGNPAAPHSQWGNHSEFAFSPDSMFIAFGMDDGTVQRTDTGVILFGFRGNPPIFSPDSRLLATVSGIYGIPSGELLFEFPFYGGPPDSQVVFSNDNALFALSPSIYEAGRGAFCALYGIRGTSWPYRSGMVRLNQGGVLPVYATTSDRKWLRIDEDTWIATADVVEFFALPRGIPIEKRN